MGNSERNGSGTEQGGEAGGGKVDITHKQGGQAKSERTRCCPRWTKAGKATANKKKLLGPESWF